jgi:hypothetical protein
MSNYSEKATILDLFKDKEVFETNSGYKTECPSCGLQGGRTHGFILDPERNIAFCHSTGKWFTLLETYALKRGVITCIEGREKGQKGKILSPEQFKETLDLLQEDLDEQEYSSILDLMNIRKRVELPGNGVYVSTFASDLVKGLKTTGEMFFRDDLRAVVEITDKGFEIIKPNRFITLVERHYKPWYKFFQKSGDYLEMNKSMTNQMAATVLVSPQFQDKLPKIKRIFTVPIPVEYEGELTFPIKGYDKRFNSWLYHNSPKIDDRIGVEDAKEIIRNIYSEFCFQEEQDYINALAGLITPFLRGLYSSWNVRSPNFVYTANRERAGKDYCANITGLVLEGEKNEQPPISSGEYKTSGSNDEIRKKLFTAMMFGKKRFHSSNNRGRINNAVYESIITAESYTDRVLGSNDMKSIDNEMDYSLSGNVGMTMTPDLMNRSRFVRLFLDIEDANSRKFKNPNLHKWVLENRELIISAIYSLIKNWYENGKPKGSVAFASYPEWAEICGGIMEAADLGNPCKKIGDMDISMDDETDEMKQLFEFVHEKKPGDFMDKKQIKELIENEDLFSYFDFDKKSDQTKFGKKLNKYVGRVLSDIRLIVKDKSVRTQRWEYKFIREKSNFSSNFDEKAVFLGKNGQNDGHVGHLGHILPMLRDSLYIENMSSSKNVSDVTNVTKNQSDRQIQFYDAKECQNIKPDFTKEELKVWIEQNPDHSDKEIYDKFGVGCFKTKEELKNGEK